MAVTELHVDAAPERCFEVLSDPRAFAYWVVGSRKIRAADPDWPAVGSKFHHTLEMGVESHTEVKEVEPNRRLRLHAHGRPFGSAFVTVTIQPDENGSRLRLEEEPASRVSRLLHNRLADLILDRRNVRSLERLKALSENTLPTPPGELPAEPEGGGIRHHRRRPVSRAAGGFGRGVAAGLVGGAAMSASTAADMRLTGRPPSMVPARAVERILGIRRLGGTAERRATIAAHLTASALTGGLWGATTTTGLPRLHNLYLIAVAPDAAVVPAMGLAAPPWRWSAADLARTTVHHAVFAAACFLTFARLED